MLFYIYGLVNYKIGYWSNIIAWLFILYIWYYCMYFCGAEILAVLKMECDKKNVYCIQKNL